MRGKQLLQMLKTLELLSLKEGTTIRGFVNGLSITTSSVYRLLETMQEAGFSIWDEKILNKKEKRWHIENDSFCKLPNLSLSDFKFTELQIITDHAASNLLDVMQKPKYYEKGTYDEKHI